MATDGIVVIIFAVYTNIKSFCCTPETNTMSCVNYISVRERGRDRETEREEGRERKEERERERTHFNPLMGETKELYAVQPKGGETDPMWTPIQTFL